jgi:hypothetical protein
MSNANMKLVLLDVMLPDKLDIPEAKLDEGEFITKRVVEVDKLAQELKGKYPSTISGINTYVALGIILLQNMIKRFVHGTLKTTQLRKLLNHKIRVSLSMHDYFTWLLDWNLQCGLQTRNFHRSYDRVCVTELNNARRLGAHRDYYSVI